MSEYILNAEAQADFLNLDVVKKNLIECWFEGQKLVIPSGQGKAVKGIVLCSLDAFKAQQAKIDELQKRVGDALQMLSDWDDQTYRDDAEQLIGELGDVLRGEP